MDKTQQTKETQTKGQKNTDGQKGGGDLSVALKLERKKTADLKKRLSQLEQEQKPVSVDDIDVGKYLSDVNDDLLDKDAEEVKKILASKFKEVALVAKKSGIVTAKKQNTAEMVANMVSEKMAIFAGTDVADDVEHLVLAKVQSLSDDSSFADIVAVVDGVVNKFGGLVNTGEGASGEGASGKTGGTGASIKNPNNHVKLGVKLPEKIESFSDVSSVIENFKKGI